RRPDDDADDEAEDDLLALRDAEAARRAALVGVLGCGHGNPGASVAATRPGQRTDCARIDSSAAPTSVAPSSPPTSRPTCQRASAPSDCRAERSRGPPAGRLTKRGWWTPWRAAARTAGAPAARAPATSSAARCTKLSSPMRRLVAA